MTDPLYSQLKRKYNEVYSVRPNDLHFTTGNNLFKRVAPLLKENPFMIILPVSIVVAVCAYVLVPPLITHVASILQHGF